MISPWSLQCSWLNASMRCASNCWLANMAKQLRISGTFEAQNNGHRGATLSVCNAREGHCLSQVFPRHVGGVALCLRAPCRDRHEVANLTCSEGTSLMMGQWTWSEGLVLGVFFVHRRCWDHKSVMLCERTHGVFEVCPKPSRKVSQSSA